MEWTRWCSSSTRTTRCRALTQQQLRDIYAGKITNWKDVGGKDQAIVAFQRRRGLRQPDPVQKLLIQGGELMDPPLRAGSCRHG
ncbi:MAG: substrate-binding domain-containing protein [Faecalibacterium prausnitzii]